MQEGETFTFASWMVGLMKEQGLSLTQLAKRSGVSHSAIINWTKHGKNADADAVVKVANALGVDPAEALQISGRDMGVVMTEKILSKRRRLLSLLDQIGEGDLEILEAMIRGLVERRARERKKK